MGQSLQGTLTPIRLAWERAKRYLSTPARTPRVRASPPRPQAPRARASPPRPQAPRSQSPPVQPEPEQNALPFTPEPHHAPPAPSEEKQTEVQGAQEQLSQARVMREAARKKIERMKTVLQELMRTTRDCPGSDVPFDELAQLVQQAEDEEKNGGNAEEIMAGGVARIEEQLREAHEERTVRYPQPEFLAPFIGCQMINIGVAGGPGTGKSTFINTARGLKSCDEEALRTSAVGQCTMEEKRVDLCFPELGGMKVNLWDLPGGGTNDFPSKTYIRDFGIRYFDCVLCFTTRTWLESESSVIAELKKNHVPYFIVRNQVDVAINAAIVNKEEELDAEELSHDIKQQVEKDTIDEIKHKLVVVKELGNRAYCISSRYKNQTRYDFPTLVHDLVAAVKTGKVDMNRNCPICFLEFADHGGEGGACVMICSQCRCNTCSQCLPSLDVCPLCRGALE